MKHFYTRIQGWSHYLVPAYRHIMYRLEMDKPHVVEVGCWAGRSTACLAVELYTNKSEFILHWVDHWQGCDEPYYEKDEVKQRNVFEEFKNNLKPVLEYITIHRSSSVEASKQFKDKSLELVCIDDGHDYESVKASIDAWWPKVKTGGWMIGDDHDEHYPDVVRAVQEKFGNDYYIMTATGMTETTDLADKEGAWIIQKR